MRTSRRNLIAAMEQLQIDDVEPGPHVHDNIQMVYIMGDTAAPAPQFVPGWTAPNPIPIEYSFQIFINGVALEFIRIELLALATGGGLYITALYDHTVGTDSVNVWTLPALTGLATRNLPTAVNSSAFGTGAAATAILDSGTSGVAPPVNSERMDISENANARPEQISGDGLTPLYIGPGRVFVMQHIVVGAGEFLGISWREIA